MNKKRKAFWVCAFVLCAATVAAETRVVVFSPDGAMVSGATVTVHRLETWAAARSRLVAGGERPVVDSEQTDESGVAVLEKQMPPDAVVSVVANGFAPFRQVLDGRSCLTVVMNRAETVVGKVTTSNGSPIRGAMVVWQGIEQERWSAETDDEGRYSVPDPRKWGQLAYVIHPDVGVVRRNAMTLGGEFSKEAANLELPEVERISGSVIGLDGGPASGAVIRSRGWELGRTAENGEFSIPIVRGRPVWAERSELVSQIQPARDGLRLDLAHGRTVTGSVAAGDGASAPRAFHVVVWSSDAEGAVADVWTDASGRFEVGRLPAAEYTVQASRVVDPRLEASDVVNLETESSAHVEIAVPVGLTFRGRVETVSNEGIQGALVTAVPNRWPLAVGGSDGFLGRTVVSDCQGAFELAVDLAQYEARIVAVKPGFAPSLPLQLTSDLASERVTLELPPGIPVSGVVVDASGRPIPDAAIVAFGDSPFIRAIPLARAWRDTPLRPIYRSDADGRFTIPLLEGRWTLSAMTPGLSPGGVRDLEVDSDTEPVRIELGELYRLTGRVVAHDGHPLEGVRLHVQLMDGAYVDGFTSDDGTFFVEVTSAGTAMVTATDRTTNRTEPIQTEIPGPPVRIAFPEVFNLEGIVVDGSTNETIESASVSLKRLGQSEGQWLSAQTEFDGRFLVLGVLPGRYVLAVEADGYLRAESEELSVPLDPSARDCEVRLTKGFTISGRVLDEEGRGIEGASVRAEQSDRTNQRSVQGADSDADGAFSISGIAAGRVTLEAEAETFIRQVEVIEIEDSANDVVLTLSKGAALSCRVVDASGRPVEGASVTASTRASDGGSQYGVSDEDGTVELNGLVDAPYEIEARDHALGKGTIHSVNPSRQKTATIVLEEPATGEVHGTVSGVPEESVVVVSVDRVNGEYPRVEDAAVDRNGAYRIESVPEGAAHVVARMIDATTRRQRSIMVAVVADESTQADFDFDTGSLVSGRVIRSGDEVPGARLWFEAESSASEMAVTDAQGRYSIAVPDGTYSVRVNIVGTKSETFEVDVAGPTTFDAIIGEATLEGVVVSGGNGEPVSGAEVEYQSLSMRGDRLSSSSLTTGSDGRFRFEEMPQGPIRIKASHRDYAQYHTSLDMGQDEFRTLEIALESAEETRVVIVDRLSGTPLSGTVVARDLAGNVVFDGRPKRDGRGVLLPLPEGTYRVSASATHFATTTVVASIPVDQIVVELDLGGTLMVHSENPHTRAARLVMPSGEVYVRCWCNRIEEIRLEGNRTEIDNVAAGSYQFVVDELDGSQSSYQVFVVEGQTTEIRIE